MARTEEVFYHDDPVQESQSPAKKKFSSIIAFLLFLVGGTYLVQTTLAANISLNAGSPLEFGQGISATTACSGSTNLTITPNSRFINSSGAGAFYFSSVTVANIPSSCNGKDFIINAYDNANGSPLALFNSTSTRAVVYSNAGTFEPGTGTFLGASVTSGSGTFTITFTNPVALSGSVFRVTLQSAAHVESASLGVNWVLGTVAAQNTWQGITYGNGIFVAVSGNGGNRVMTSEDGFNWTARNSDTSNALRSITYGNGLFVAVAYTGASGRVLTSSDGITWTSRNAAANNTWYSITFGNGLFVAVASDGDNRVMTSPEGITWTSRSAAAVMEWYGVTYGNGLFVAVAGNGSGNRVMTSPDGITWTARTSATNNSWRSVTYGEGIFVAVSYSGSGNRVMTSPNGIDWTSRNSAADTSWARVIHGNGTFVAVAENGSGARVMTSPDGITWTSQSSERFDWSDVAYGNGRFVSVAYVGRTMGEVMVSTS